MKTEGIYGFFRLNQEKYSALNPVVGIRAALTHVGRQKRFPVCFLFLARDLLAQGAAHHIGKTGFLDIGPLQGRAGQYAFFKGAFTHDDFAAFRIVHI